MIEAAVVVFVAFVVWKIDWLMRHAFVRTLLVACFVAAVLAGMVENEVARQEEAFIDFHAQPYSSTSYADLGQL